MPIFCIHTGARLTVPAAKSNAAPTPRMGPTSRLSMYFAAHFSCLGDPTPTKSISAPDSLIILTILLDSSSSCSKPKGGL